MHTKEFIQATHEILQKGTEPSVVFKSLRSYLERRGLLKKYPGILRGLLEREIQNQKNIVPLVRVARKEDLTHHASEIKKLLAEFESDTHTALIDTSLIGGFSIENIHKKIDKSHKHHLLQAYRRLQETSSQHI